MRAGILVLNLAFLLFISYRIWSLEQSSLRKFFWPALVLKLIGGICLGLVYSYYYSTGDTFHYFHDGVRLASLARTDAISYFSFLWAGDESFPISSELIYKQPRAMFLSKVTSLFCLLTADNYWMIALYFSAISFFSAWFLVQKINHLFEGVQPAAILSFLFFPSVVFWSAGVIKESLAMAALFFLSFIFLKVWKREKLRWTRMAVDRSFFMDRVELKILLPRDFPAGCFHNAYPSIPAHKIYFKKFGEQGADLVFDIYDSDSPGESSSSEFLLRKIYGSCGFQLL